MKKRMAMLSAVVLLSLATVSLFGDLPPRASSLFSPTSTGSEGASSPPAQTRRRSAPPTPASTAAKRAGPECDAEAWARKFERATHVHARGLMAEPDSRSQLIAASLLESYDDNDPNRIDAETAAAAALRLGMNDPLVLWMAAMDCPGKTQACDADTALKRLQRLEPDNGAVWLASMARAQRRGDEEAVDAALQRAARAAHFRTAYVEYGQEMLFALRQVKVEPMSACASERFAAASGLKGGQQQIVDLTAMGRLLALVMPGGPSVGEVCRAPLRHRHRACVDALAKMAESNELADRLMALAYLVPLTADRADGAHWRERMRRLSWLRERMDGSGNDLPPDWLGRALLLGEIPAFEAWLAEQGLPTEPPPNWLPDDPRQRALILTGRPPPPSSPVSR